MNGNVNINDNKLKIERGEKIVNWFNNVIFWMDRTEVGTMEGMAEERCFQTKLIEKIHKWFMQKKMCLKKYNKTTFTRKKQRKIDR